MGTSRPPPAKLKRRKAKRGPRIWLALFVEGRRTEVNYFENVKREAENRLLTIEGPCGVPALVVEKAITYKKKRKRRVRDSFERADQVWAVFDCDEHDVAPAITRARDNRVYVAFSNSCFELWGLLHLADHDAPIERHALQNLLESKMPNYDKDGSKCFDYEQMKVGYEDADHRAERMEVRRVRRRRSDGESVYECL